MVASYDIILCFVVVGPPSPNTQQLDQLNAFLSGISSPEQSPSSVPPPANIPKKGT